MDLEIKETQKHEIKIVALEQTLNIPFDVPGLDFHIALKGKIDRIDTKDGTLRIIDYKTGNVKANSMIIENWEDLTSDYKYNKAFQLLCYAFMHNATQPKDMVNAGIISFKTLQSGMQAFATKKKVDNKKIVKDHDISAETLANFEVELKKLILEICDPQIPLTEKEV